MIVRLRPRASVDLEAAFHYYENKSPGLGRRLLDEFRVGIEHILQFPDAYPRLDREYRRYRLENFPYGIIYRRAKSKSIVFISAFAHLSRRPGGWRD